jgi:hypothetical protein
MAKTFVIPKNLPIEIEVPKFLEEVKIETPKRKLSDDLNFKKK